MRAPLDLIGKRFGKLLVTSRSGNKTKTGQLKWHCVCDCGCIKEVVGNNLVSGNTKGCLKCRPAPNKKLPTGTSACNSLKSRYRITAKERKVPFELSTSEFKSLVLSNCFYCDTRPEQIVRNGNDSFIYNGIDRIDSSLGYYTDNVVPCCKRCNFAKHTMSQIDFFEHIKKIIKNLSKKSLI